MEVPSETKAPSKNVIFCVHDAFPPELEPFSPSPFVLHLQVSGGGGESGLFLLPDSISCVCVSVC